MDQPRHSTKKQHDKVLLTLKDAASSEPKAVQFIEDLRWGNNPICPHCGSENVYQMKDRKFEQRNKDFRWRCRACKRQYSVRTDTVMEETRLPVRYWVHAFWRACASKKGVSSLQLSRELDITQKSAWFLLHRVRLAMSDWGQEAQKLGGEGKTVEADETYVGGKPRYKGNNKRGRGTKKTPVFAAVERGGKVKMQVMQRLTEKDLRRVLEIHVDDRTRLMTDELATYKPIGVRFSGGHHTVTHSAKEYVNKENPEIHSNTSESVFALVKRSVYGTFHSVSKKHLPRYLSEIEFRWNNRNLSDAARTLAAVKQAEGKRLIYREEDVEGTISGWDTLLVLQADGTCIPLKPKKGAGMRDRKKPDDKKGRREERLKINGDPVEAMKHFLSKKPRNKGDKKADRKKPEI